MDDASERLRRPRRTPLRVRLTVAFASVIALLLAATGLLVVVQFAHDFDRRVDAELLDRGRTLRTLAARSSSPRELVALSGEALAQVYDRDGRLLASSSRAAGVRLLSPGGVRRAARRALFSRATRVDGDDGARVRAFALPGGRRIAAIAEPLQPREASLHGLAFRLAITLPAALLLASIAGYQVAGGAMRPVERMRARAAAIGASELHERLPEPGTRDELDRLAITLNDLLARLEGAVERERRIVGDASHELRNPIAVLRTRVEVALRGDGGRAQLRAALAGALRDAERLSRLADDLLVLARADEGRLPLRREPLDVQDVLEQAAERHRAAAAAAGRELVVTIAIAGGALVDGDPDRVAQALDNLVVNALRHGGGTIELRGAAEPDGIALAVRDRGPGLPPDFLPRAFERFSQAATGHGGEGSGLGLALAEAIARAHGGRATVRNRRDGGAEAALVLPRLVP